MAGQVSLGFEEREFLLARDDPFGSRYGLGRSGLTGLALGGVGGGHLVVLLQLLGGALAWSVPLARWCVYVVALCAFHAAEFATTARYKPADLSYDSWLVNHSVAYVAAAGAAAFEFWAEYAFAPWLKSSSLLLVVGTLIVAAGHGARVAAMVTCGSHFAHRIMVAKDPAHRLVTNGIYSYLRHPSYTGWFWWSVGTQVVLANPLCAVCYACASYNFFADRIPFEEETLRAFYPKDYAAYAKRTRVLIPFIRDTARPDPLVPGAPGSPKLRSGDAALRAVSYFGR